MAGKLYGSIHVVKTHANMGNLFGWIYGDMPEEFREATWARYVENLDANGSKFFSLDLDPVAPVR